MDHMIVFQSNGVFRFWCDVDARIIDRGGSWDVESRQIRASGIKKASHAYAYYDYRPIARQYDEEGNERPVSMKDLALVPLEAPPVPTGEQIDRLRERVEDLERAAERP